MKKLLLHSCCGPCSTTVIKRLANDYEITVFYFNPNIEPLKEYSKRKKEQIKFLKLFNSNIHFIEGDYCNDSFHQKINDYENLYEGSIRCYNCIEFRLEETAKYAAKNHYDFFDSTLSVSPHKNSSWIIEIGNNLANKYQIGYVNGNYKKNNGYQESVILAKQYNLYRQEYCGCLKSMINNKTCKKS